MSSTDAPGVPDLEWAAAEPYAFCPLEGIQGNRPPTSAALAGRSFTVALPAGDELRLGFLDGTELDLVGADGAASRVPYEAFEVRPGKFVVAFLPDARLDHAQTWFIDIEAGRAVLADTRLSLVDEPAVETTVSHLGLDGAACEEYSPTDELVGRRVLYNYGPGVSFEHIYLEPHLFTWHATIGDEGGHADTEPTRVYKLDDQLYFFAWTERVKPHDGVVVIDLAEVRSVGRLYGWDDETERVMHVTVSGHGEHVAAIA